MKYVYTHSINGVIFYVGCGGKARPYNLKNRNKRWHEFVELFGNPDIEIVGMFDTKDDAMLKEYALISKHLPCCNILRADPRLSPANVSGIKYLNVEVSDLLKNDLKKYSKKSGFRIGKIVELALISYIKKNKK